MPPRPPAPKSGKPAGPAKPGARSELDRSKSGKLKSKRAKIGGDCSTAMSQWKTSGMTPAIAATLGKCRARARLQRSAEGHAGAGREGMAANLQRRSEGQYVTQRERLDRAKEIRAARAESAKVNRTPASRAAGTHHILRDNDERNTLIRETARSVNPLVKRGSRRSAYRPTPGTPKFRNAVQQARYERDDLRAQRAGRQAQAGPKAEGIKPSTRALIERTKQTAREIQAARGGSWRPTTDVRNPSDAATLAGFQHEGFMARLGADRTRRSHWANQLQSAESRLAQMSANAQSPKAHVAKAKRDVADARVQLQNYDKQAAATPRRQVLEARRSHLLRDPETQNRRMERLARTASIAPQQPGVRTVPDRAGVREAADRARAAKGTREDRVARIRERAREINSGLRQRYDYAQGPDVYRVGTKPGDADRLMARNQSLTGRVKRLVGGQGTPSVRQQADAARQAKGTREQRIERIKTRAREINAWLRQRYDYAAQGDVARVGLRPGEAARLMRRNQSLTGRIKRLRGNA